ncbi:MAG: hypothetical protein RJB13_2201 [Pseudomonadota bacterium]
MKSHYQFETKSTMDLARAWLQSNTCSEPVAFLCTKQSAGRGRGGSAWLQSQMPEEEKVLRTRSANPIAFESFSDAVRHASYLGPCTFVFPASSIQIPATWMSLAVGCALSDALGTSYRRLRNQMDFLSILPEEIPYEAKIKWPNDLWLCSAQTASSLQRTGKKIAGILCETSFRGEALQYVSVGIGLNVLAAPPDVAYAGCVLELWGVAAQQLTQEQKSTLQIVLAEEISRELTDYLCTARTAEQLRMLTLDRSLPLGTRLSVNKGETVGHFAGLTTDGGLLLEGHAEPVIAGDVAFISDLSEQPRGENLKCLDANLARLCLDFGNSFVHWRIEMGMEVRCGSTPWSELDKKSLTQTKLFRRIPMVHEILQCVGSKKQIEMVWADVAIDSQSRQLVRALEDALATDCVGREIALYPLASDEILKASGLEADYAEGQMGVDRALHVWVASDIARRNEEVVAVFSLGTAFTGVVVDDSGRLIESFILPGVGLCLSTLHAKTARLPLLRVPDEMPSVECEPPFSTQHSILHGVSLQIHGVVSAVASAHGVSSVILTGGDAASVVKIISKAGAYQTLLDTDLVLKAMSQFVAKEKLSRFRMEKEVSEGAGGPPEKVLQSMLRARLSKRRSQRVALDRIHFRRLGGRLEHVGVGLRIDRHLGEKFKFHTRDIWQERVDIGEVMVEQNSPKNHETDAPPETLINIKSTYVLKQGDQIWLFHPPEYEPDMATHVEVVHDDGDAAVFCKPGNLVVHAAGLYGKNTFIEIAKRMGYADTAPVHRIDRETSGLLVCARSTPLRRELSLSFRDSSVKKMYLAVTRGNTPVPSQFRIDFPIGSADGSRIRLKLWHNTHDGLDALTHCVHLAGFEDYSLFACLPQTGRTNQIRVHLAAIGHWIVGDKMYHPDEEVFLKFYEEGFTDFVAEKAELPRHWLHNTGIQFMASPHLSVGRAPVIAPLTEDLLLHEPTLNLLQQAGLPREPQKQLEAFSALFKQMLKIDFSQAPVIQPDA